jgi:hypothetical protein
MLNLAEIGALAHIATFASNGQEVDSACLSAQSYLEVAKRPQIVLVEGQISRVLIATLRHELAYISAFVLQ